MMTEYWYIDYWLSYPFKGDLCVQGYASCPTIIQTSSQYHIHHSVFAAVWSGVEWKTARQAGRLRYECRICHLSHVNPHTPLTNNRHKQLHDTLFMPCDKCPAVVLHTFHALRKKTKALSITFGRQRRIFSVCWGRRVSDTCSDPRGRAEVSGNRTVTAAVTLTLMNRAHQLHQHPIPQLPVWCRFWTKSDAPFLPIVCWCLTS